MKTTTIYRALRKAMKKRDYYGRGFTAEKTAKYVKFDRQADRLHKALLARIESGDRAREALPRIARAIQVGDYDMAMGIVLDKFMRDDYPEYYKDEQP